MKIRRRLKQVLSLSDRLKVFSDQLKAKAAELRAGAKKEALIKRARTADTASRIDQWANSPGLRPPE